MRYQLNHHSLPGTRPSNEDRIAVAERDNAVLMVLADGLGGHQGGELASELLTQTMVRAFRAVKSREIARPSAFLALAILQAHNAIVRMGRSHAPPLEPRTTCVACLVQDGYAYWAHVGDSRLYHFRTGQMIARTHDHTSVEQLHQDGLLTEQEMQDHPYKSRLLKCVGGPNRPSIALGEETPLARGDVLLLVSDGVWEALAPEELAGFLARADLEESVEEMLLASQRKMKEHCDNISAVAFRWQDETVKALPKQGNVHRVQVDQERLWKDAQHWLTETKVQQSRQAQRPEDRRKGSIEAEIEALEQFLKQIEPKPRGS
jgi:serine/threonine protein phosphatase PrpC